MTSAVLSQRQVNIRILKRQQWVRALVYLIFVLIVFEGALRKWVFPQYEEILFFLRAPFTLLIYALALSIRIFPRLRLPHVIVYVFGFLVGVLVLFQLMLGGYSPRHLLLAGYGWYSYFFYILLGFLIAEQFRWQDMFALARLTLWLALVSVGLVAWQFFSSPYAPINAGFGIDEAHQFIGLRSAQGYIRPMGFFTTAAGQGILIRIVLVFVLYTWFGLRYDQKRIPAALYWGGTLATLVMLGLSQSRSTVISTVFLLLVAMLAAFITRSRSLLRQILLGLVLLTLIFSVVWPVVLPTSYSVFMQRWQSASSVESRYFELGTSGRILYSLYSFMLYIEDTPLQGHLVGIGSNAANQLSWVELPVAYFRWNGYGNWAEPPFSNHIVELGPIFGVAFILYRLLLLVWLGWLSTTSSARSHNPLPLLFFGITSLLLVFGHITSQGTVTGFFWFLFGLNLAACRLVTQRGKI